MRGPHKGLHYLLRMRWGLRENFEQRSDDLTFKRPLWLLHEMDLRWAGWRWGVHLEDFGSKLDKR